VRRAWDLLAVAAVLAAIAAGVSLRLKDPSSSPQLAAEDPYTHMALVREHLRTGTLGSLNPGTQTYPPGLHALLAAVWTATGLELYDIFRYGAVVLGAVGILGVGVLLHRTAGPAAAATGAWAMAVLPEGVFRTTMLAPTALDLALLPFLVLCLAELGRGRLAAAWPGAALVLLLLLAHPWVFALLAPAAAIATLLALWAPGRRALHPHGVALVLLLVGVPLAASLAGCWGACGIGFRDVAPDLAGTLASMAPWASCITAFTALGLWVLEHRLQPGLDRDAARPHPIRRSALCVLLATAAVAILVPALQAGLPSDVDLVHMVGMPLLALAAAGLVVAPWVRGPASPWAAAWVLVTLPLTVTNPLDSPFWPERTAAYLGLGLALLAGLAAGAAARVVGHLATRRRAAQDPRSNAAAAPVSWRTAPLAAVLLLVAPVAIGSASAAAVWQTPQYASGWYRLYDDCAFHGLQEVAAAADAAPRATVVTGSWQAKLVLAALAANASRVWYDPDFFVDAGARSGLSHRPLLVVVDPDMPADTAANLTFLGSPAWTPRGSWCAGPSAAGDKQTAGAVQLHARGA